MHKHLLCIAFIAISSTAHAALITQTFNFGNSGNAITSVSQTFNDGNIEVEFTLNFSNPNGAGAVVESDQGDGLGVAGNFTQDIDGADEAIQVDLTITNLTILNQAYRTISDLTFIGLGGAGAGQGIIRGNFQESQGEFLVPDSAGAKPWRDSNSPFPGESQFVNEPFNGFSLYGANGRQNLTTFTSQWANPIVFTPGFNSWAINGIQVGVTANPEPSSLALGFVAIGGVVGRYGRRRFFRNKSK